MSGCFRYSSSSKKNNQDISNSNDYDNDDYANQTGDYRRKKRAVQSKKNVTNDMESMCAKYFKLEEAIECQVFDFYQKEKDIFLRKKLFFSNYEFIFKENNSGSLHAGNWF